MENILGLNLEKIWEFLVNNWLLIIWLIALGVLIYLGLSYLVESKPKKLETEEDEFKNFLEEILGKLQRNENLVEVIKIITQKIISEVIRLIEKELASPSGPDFIDQLQIRTIVKEEIKPVVDQITNILEETKETKKNFNLFFKEIQKIKSQINEIEALHKSLPENIKVVLASEIEDVLKDLTEKVIKALTPLTQDKDKEPSTLKRIKKEIERRGVPGETQEVIEEAFLPTEKKPLQNLETALEINPEDIEVEELEEREEGGRNKK